jgi:hypothetical protein
MFSLGTFQRIFVTKLFLFLFLKGYFAPLCVPLGLKKPGDFTVSEGIRLQIFRFFGGWFWSEGKKKKPGTSGLCPTVMGTH